MREYYFVSTSLPSLVIGEAPEIDFHSLMYLFYDNLKEQDLKQVEVIRRYWDMLNLLHYWKEEPFEPYGNLNQNQESESLLKEVGLPDYVYDFIAQYHEKEEKVRRFPALLTAYFKEEKKEADGFTSDFISLERDLRILLAAFRAKALKRDIVKELQDEDAYERIVASALAQKDTKEFFPPSPYEDLKPVFEKYQLEPLSLYQALTEYRFEKYETLSGTDPFSIRRLLAYMVQLILVEKWLELDRKKGQDRLMERLLDKKEERMNEL